MVSTERGPLLAGWILVRVGRMARTRRRYVLLRRDLVMEVGTLHVPVVGAQVVPQPRERALRLRARTHAPLRLVLDTQLQFAKWNDALQTAALWELQRFYAVSENNTLARGRFSLLRPATVLPSRLRVGPCPAVYTPRLDHFFVPSATNSAFAPADAPDGAPRNADSAASDVSDDEMMLRRNKIRASVSEHGTMGAAWGDDNDSIDTDPEPTSTSAAHVTAVTAVSVGFGDRSTRDAAPDSAGPTRARRSFGSFRAAALAAAARSTIPRSARRRSALLSDPAQSDDGPEVVDVTDGAAVIPGTYNAAQLLRVQTGFSRALRASLEGSEYRGCPAVVIKSIARDGLGRAVAASEALVAHAHLRHHGLVCVLDVFETPVVVHSVLERLEGPNLRAHLAARKGAPLDERAAARACRTLLKAVGYLHACGIVHWDIRADNVVFVGGKENAPKLLDFGSARSVDPYTGVLRADDSLLTTRRPLPCVAAAAPEMLAAKAHLFAPKTDMWQMGCLLYTMLVGRSPFERSVPVPLSTAATKPQSAPPPKSNNDRDSSTMTVEESGDNGLSALRRPRSMMTSTDDVVRKSIFEFCKLRASARHAYLFALDNTGGVSVGAHARQLVSQLLTPNPRMRPNALACLQTAPFLQNVN